MRVKDEVSLGVSEVSVMSGSLHAASMTAIRGSRATMQPHKTAVVSSSNFVHNPLSGKLPTPRPK